jgi:uncharacterized protein involved in outer membrane biogenesis
VKGRARKLALAAVAVAATLALVVVAVPWQTVLARLAEQRLAAATGCDVGIEGPVGLQPGWISEIRLASLAFSPREGSSRACHGELGELDLSLRLWALRIEGVRARKGRFSFGGAPATVLAIERLEIQPGEEAGILDAELAGHLEHGSERLPLEVSSKLDERDAALRVHDFSLKAGRHGLFEISASGNFEDVSALDGLDARLDLKARDLALLGELVGLGLPSAGPVALSGSIAARERRLRADDVALDIGKSHIRGQLSVELPRNGRPTFDVRVDAPSLRLADVGVRPREEEDASASTATAGWSDEPFALEPLRSFDAKLVARAADVRGVGGPLLDEMSFEGELEQGRLSLRHVSVAVDGGRLTGELRADVGSSPPDFSLEADARGLQLARLLEEIEGSDAYSGALHGQLKLRARGASPRQLARSLAGEVLAASSGGSVSTEHASLLTRDFFSVLRPSRRKKSEVLNCLVVDLGFAAGVGDVRWWLVDLQDLVVIGDGRVDLADRRFDLRFVPKPRDPSPLSTAATIRLTGPLSAPRVSTEKGSLIVSTTKALLETLPWLSRSRSALRGLLSAGAPFGHCRELPH